MVKVSSEKYRLELFRVIDFGIFDQEYKLCVLVEINDPSHETPERERDKKVVEIYERVLQEFKLASDEEYDLLRKQIFR